MNSLLDMSHLIYMSYVVSKKKDPIGSELKQCVVLGIPDLYLIIFNWTLWIIRK